MQWLDYDIISIVLNHSNELVRNSSNQISVSVWHCIVLLIFDMTSVIEEREKQLYRYVDIFKKPTLIYRAKTRTVDCPMFILERDYLSYSLFTYGLTKMISLKHYLSQV